MCSPNLLITILTVDLAPSPTPRFHKYSARLACMRDADRQRDVGVLILHCQVAGDSTGGATSNSEMSKLAYYRHVHYTLASICAKIV